MPKQMSMAGTIGTSLMQQSTLRGLAGMGAQGAGGQGAAQQQAV